MPLRSLKAREVGMRMKSRRKNLWNGFLKILPCFLFIGAVILLIRGFGFDEILEYAPKKPLWTILILWCLYILKSFTVIFPICALYIAGGLLLPAGAAIAVNIAGAALAMIGPYCYGRHYGPDLAEKLNKRYPKLGSVRTLREEHEFAFIYVLRSVAVLSGDLVSAYLGAVKVSMHRYLLGGILAYLPDILAYTVIGKSLLDPASKTFLCALLAVIVYKGATIYLAYRIEKRKSS